jgi:hypothetical protein
MSGLPDYIPAKAPGHAVIDLSGTLSQGQLEGLDNFAKTLTFKPRVIILPKTYKAANDEELHSLATDIASAWHVEGNRMLLAVDLSGKKLRAIAGDDLKSHGITNQYLKRTVWPNYFYPYVRKGDIEGALRNSLKAVQARELATQGTGTQYAGVNIGGTTGPSNAGNAANQSMIVPASPGLSDTHAGSNAMLWMGSLIILAAVAIYFIINNSNKDKNNRLTKALTERLGKLYATADELGQASEYIVPQSNKEVALKVSSFFEKLQALDKAKDEIEKFTATKRWGKANDALLPALKLTDKLNVEGEGLLENVSAITGGVDSMKLEEKDKKGISQRQGPGQNQANSDGTAMTTTDGEPHKIKIDMATPYQRPSWSYQQEYNQPIFANYGQSSGGGIFDMLFLLNQMDNSRRLDNLERNQSSWSAGQGGNNFFSGSNNSGTSSANAGSDTNRDASDHGSSGSSIDSGGDWGSSSNSSDSSDSSDFSSSVDSGGDWGSSSDSSDSSGSFDSDSGSDSGGDW